MAIAFDAFTAGTVAGAGGGPFTFSHTCTGSNRILVVLINQNGVDAVTGVTYNGVALTQAIKRIRTLGTSEAYIYYLLNPASGANTVSVSVSSNPNQIDIDAISYTGATQSGTPDTGFIQDTDTSAGGNFTASVTVSTANSWMVAMKIDSSANATSSVGATLRSASYVKNSVEDTNGTVGSGAQTIGYGWPAATNGTTVIAMAFAPFQTTISVSDTVTVSESVALVLSQGASFSVNDTVTVTESVTVLITAFKPSVFDSVTVTESISIAESAILLSIFDSVTITESITERLISYASAFDLVTVTDVPTVSPVESYSIFDLVTVTENMNITSIDDVMNPTSSWGLKILN